MTKDNYETITRVVCSEEKDVEKGAWALEKDLREPCYCEYRGG